VNDKRKEDRHDQEDSRRDRSGACCGLVATGAISAAAAEKPPKAAAPPVLVGTWDVTLTLPGAPPGRVLATFNIDRTTVESAAAPGTVRGASHGVWRIIERNLFAVTRVFFRFNPQTGAYLGTQKVNATVRVAPDGNTFSAVSISEQRDPAGAIVATGLRGTAQGARMQVEPIPDRP
jgi:hypothetical protein